MGDPGRVLLVRARRFEVGTFTGYRLAIASQTRAFPPTDGCFCCGRERRNGRVSRPAATGNARASQTRSRSSWAPAGRDAEGASGPRRTFDFGFIDADKSKLHGSTNEGNTEEDETERAHHN